MHPLRNILNRIIWDEKEDRRKYMITYIHRGVPGNNRKIRFTDIIKVGKSWISLIHDEEETVIPFHRIIIVENIETQKVLWRKR